MFIVQSCASRTELALVTTPVVAASFLGSMLPAKGQVPPVKMP